MEINRTWKDLTIRGHQRKIKIIYILNPGDEISDTRRIRNVGKGVYLRHILNLKDVQNVSEDVKCILRNAQENLRGSPGLDQRTPQVTRSKW